MITVNVDILVMWAQFNENISIVDSQREFTHLIGEILGIERWVKIAEMKHRHEF